MNKQTELKLRLVITGIIALFLIPVILGLPIYLLGALIGWTFDMSQWHWVLRGILGITFIGLTLMNLVTGLRALADSRSLIQDILKHNPEMSVKEAIREKDRRKKK